MSSNHDSDDLVFQFKQSPQEPNQNKAQPPRREPPKEPHRESHSEHHENRPSRREGRGQKYKNRYKNLTPARLGATLIIVCVCVGISLFLAYFALSSASDLLGINQKDRQIEIEIPDSAEGSIHKVAKILDDAGIIDQQFTFELYAKLRHMDGSDRGAGKAPRKFLAGTYVLNSRWGYDQIMSHLSVRSETKDIVQVTLSEGMTAAQIATRLEEFGVCKKEDFLAALENEYDFAFLNKIPEDNRFRQLEGYLFPDTYEFYMDMNVNEVVKKFLGNFDQRVDEELLRPMQNLSNGLGELDNVITLASLIQKEANTYEEMRRVSAVFHNRLDNPAEYPHLQSDTTKYYIRDSLRPFMNHEDQELYDSYDTTVVKGLPVGPICNPGLDAIRAALDPDPSITGYFFVSDNANHYYYADTYAQHQQNIAKARAVNEQLKKEQDAKK